MTTSELVFPAPSEQTMANWPAVAFVAGYFSPGTRQAYSTQLRLWFSWCRQHGLDPLTDIRRPHVEPGTLTTMSIAEVLGLRIELSEQTSVEQMLASS